MAATYERLDYGSPDGSHWGGASTDSLGMYGYTPVAQFGSTLVASAFPVQATAYQGSSLGLISSIHLSTMVAQVSSVVTALQRLGIMTSN